MGALVRPPSVSRRGDRQHQEPPPSSRSRSRGRLLAAGLLGMGLALLLLLVWPSLGGAGRAGQAPAPAGYRTPMGGKAAATGAVVQATEVTATPSRGEPTNVAPSGSGAPAVPAPGTVVPAASAAPTVTPPSAAPAAIEITCAQAENDVSGQICIHTTPGAALTIAVTYCNGLEARNTDLQGTRYADSYGNYTWTWVPETTCPGTATAHVTASGTGGSSDANGTFTVNP